MPYSELTGTLRRSAWTHGRFLLVGRLYEQNKDGTVTWPNYDAELRAGVRLELLEGDEWQVGQVRYADELGGYHLALPALEVAIPLEHLAEQGRTVRRVLR